ncbi:hypothetical protein C2S51_020516 [Perilla frutescens var. frutescens]|nr:hypothetical protein C2S51_020516 [Perilla frutescens var. frutescens]
MHRFFTARRVVLSYAPSNARKPRAQCDVMLAKTRAQRVPRAQRSRAEGLAQGAVHAEAAPAEGRMQSPARRLAQGGRARCGRVRRVRAHGAARSWGPRAMSGTYILLHHGGFWRDHIYYNGIEEYVRIPMRGITYSQLFDEIVDIVGEDPNIYRLRRSVPEVGTSCDIDDVQDDNWDDTCQHGRQWIIPGALYQATLPLNRLGIDMTVNMSDTLCLDAIFESKESMINALENGAYKKLLDADPTRWARCKSPVRRYEFMTSNCAECLNGRLRWARRLPVCTLLESVRTLVGQWFYHRRRAALARTHVLTETAATRVLGSVEQGQTMNVQSISATKFKVTHGMKHYTVDLVGRKCSCQVFNLDLIPCPHAAAAISKANKHVYSYVWSFYTTENLRGMYSGEVMSIAHPDDWDIPFEVSSKVELIPHNPRMSTGSRSTSRGRPYSIVCSRCQQTGHNRATCTQNIPISQGSQTSSCNANEASSSRARRTNRCNIYRVPGHTRPTCPNRPS